MRKKQDDLKFSPNTLTADMKDMTLTEVRGKTLPVWGKVVKLDLATSATKTSTTRARRSSRRSKLAVATKMPLSLLRYSQLHAPTRFNELSPFPDYITVCVHSPPSCTTRITGVSH